MVACATPSHAEECGRSGLEGNPAGQGIQKITFINDTIDTDLDDNNLPNPPLTLLLTSD